MNDITILDQYYKEILSILGYPFLNEDDYQFITRESIENYVIKPVLREYYRWFPLESFQILAVTSNSGSGGIEPFPDQYTYGVRDCRFTLEQDSHLSYGGHFLHRGVTKNRGSFLGSRMDYGFNTIQKSTQFGNDTQANNYKVFRWEITKDINGKKQLEYYSSLSGKVQVIWAKYAYDFDKVDFDELDTVIKLAQAELLLYSARIIERVNPDLPVEFDSDVMRTEGEDMREAIIEDWRTRPKAVVMRG